MAYRIIEVQTAHYPNRDAATQALEAFGLPEKLIADSLRRFVCAAPLVPDQGYQKILASELEQHLRTDLLSEVVKHTSSNYCPRLNEKADFALGRDGTDQRIYVEIEFRPNVEKDLVKFQIGYNSELLAAAVLILSSDRRTINPPKRSSIRYPTMPEFAKFIKVIRELRPNYPLLVCGILGAHLEE